jgi:hypothetical protein
MSDQRTVVATTAKGSPGILSFDPSLTAMGMNDRPCQAHAETPEAHPDPQMWARGWNCNGKLTHAAPDTATAAGGARTRGVRQAPPPSAPS